MAHTPTLLVWCDAINIPCFYVWRSKYTFILLCKGWEKIPCSSGMMGQIYLAALVCEPGDGPLGVQGLVVPIIWSSHVSCQALLHDYWCAVCHTPRTDITITYSLGFFCVCIDNALPTKKVTLFFHCFYRNISVEGIDHYRSTYST
jgi:hypothetical protein